MISDFGSDSRCLGDRTEVLYKYLERDGFRETITKSSLMFSNINRWRHGAVNDTQENYLASCIESEDDFITMIEKFKLRGLPKEKVFQWLYYICLYTYKTYASCFSGTIKNQDYMWGEFTKKGGVCVCFRDELYDELKANYSNGDVLSDIYSFEKGAIDYVPDMPDIYKTLDQIENRDYFLKVAYFTKRRDPYEKEKEIRIAITEMQYLRDFLIIQLIPFTKDYDCSFQNLTSFISGKMGMDITDYAPRFLLVEDICKYINGVYISPNTGAEDLELIKEICDSTGITILET